MTRQTALQSIITELEKAIAKHPHWPDDAIHAAAILGEESGELTQAAIDFHYSKGGKLSMFEEASQTGAMAIRFLLHLEAYKDKDGK